MVKGMAALLLLSVTVAKDAGAGTSPRTRGLGRKALSARWAEKALGNLRK